jgi:hypothetical protein
LSHVGLAGAPAAVLPHRGVGLVQAQGPSLVGQRRNREGRLDDPPCLLDGILPGEPGGLPSNASSSCS